MRHLIWLAAWSATALSAARGEESPTSEGTIEIRQIEWGFDGTAPVQMFVPLSLLVENTGPEPAEGVFRLSKSAGLNQRIDVEYEQTYFVSGFSSRWVQLTPFVISDLEIWTLRWGPQLRNKVEIPTPRNGDRATVLFANPDDRSAIGSALRRCDPALFPASLTGADSLRGAVLHAVPDWQGARVQAFLEWLQQGGRLYLVHGDDGEYPKFSGELTALNDPRDKFRIGSGIVTRLPIAVDDIDADTAKKQILTDVQGFIAPGGLSERLTTAQRLNVFPIATDFNDSILRDLQYLTRFHRNWWVVYIGAFFYVLAVYPGSYLLGRKSADWRRFYVGFLGTALLFSLGFSKLGQVGSKEQTRTRSVAAAYQLADGMYDVTQWMCAASREGDLYEIASPGSGRLYSSCQDFEAVNGVVRQADGRLDLDLPSASTCRLLSRGRTAGPSLGIKVEELVAGEASLTNLRFSFAPDVYDKTMIVCAWHAATVYEMKADPDGARLSAGRMPAGDFVGTYSSVPWTTQRRPGNVWTNTYVEPESVTEAFQRLVCPIAGSTMHLEPGTLAHNVVLDPGIVRILLFRPMPDAFRIPGEQFPDQQGYVMYVVDVPTSSP